MRLYNARCLFRVDKLTTAYSLDGRLFVRDDQNQRHYTQSEADLKHFGDPKEARKKPARLVRLPPHLRRLRNGGIMGNTRRPPNMRRPNIDENDEAARGEQ